MQGRKATALDHVKRSTASSQIPHRMSLSEGVRAPPPAALNSFACRKFNPAEGLWDVRARGDAHSGERRSRSELRAGACLPVSRMSSGCRGTQASGVARSRLSMSKMGWCCAQSGVPGTRRSSAGEPSCRGPARGRPRPVSAHGT